MDSEARPSPNGCARCACFARLELRSMHVTMASVARASLALRVHRRPVDEGHLRPGEPLAWRAHEALQHRNMR